MNFEVDIDYIVKCNACNSMLMASIGNGLNRGELMIYVDPCTACLSRENKEGYDIGKQAGWEEGAEYVRDDLRENLRCVPEEER